MIPLSSLLWYTSNCLTRRFLREEKPFLPFASYFALRQSGIYNPILRNTSRALSTALIWSSLAIEYTNVHVLRVFDERQA